jgi:hypothetical protein
MGLHPQNIVTWENNGVEYVYPDSALRDVFGGSADFAIQGDRITAGDITKTKNELCEAVVAQLDSSTALPEELERKLLKNLKDAID